MQSWIIIRGIAKLICSFYPTRYVQILHNYLSFIIWNGNSILKTESDYFVKHKELNKTVYMAYGSQDDNDWVIGPTTELIRVIQEHKYASLIFITQVFKGESHISVYPVA